MKNENLSFKWCKLCCENAITLGYPRSGAWVRGESVDIIKVGVTDPTRRLNIFLKKLTNFNNFSDFKISDDFAHFNNLLVYKYAK